MFVAWGNASAFYNDPYAEILAHKHPSALGGRFYDIWSEIWSDISPLIAAAMAGHSTYREDLPLLMNRKGYDEQTWFTFSYSPVRDESGKVRNVLCGLGTSRVRFLLSAPCGAQRDARAFVAEALAERNLLADIVEGTNAFVQVADLGPDGSPSIKRRPTSSRTYLR